VRPAGHTKKAGPQAGFGRIIDPLLLRIVFLHVITLCLAPDTAAGLAAASAPTLGAGSAKAARHAASAAHAKIRMFRINFSYSGSDYGSSWP
jgi:hypothetical protein